MLQKRVAVKREPEAFRFVTSDPALLHGTIMLAANDWMKFGGRRALMEVTLYKHKTEVIRIINQRLGDRGAAISDGTVGGITILALLEVSPKNL
jgi:hypothetical protein